MSLKVQLLQIILLCPRTGTALAKPVTVRSAGALSSREPWRWRPAEHRGSQFRAHLHYAWPMRAASGHLSANESNVSGRDAPVASIAICVCDFRCLRCAARSAAICDAVGYEVTAILAVSVAIMTG